MSKKNYVQDVIQINSKEMEMLFYKYFLIVVGERKSTRLIDVMFAGVTGTILIS
jgi:hypothetical protein